MQENVPLTIERLSDRQESECRISSARQIQSLLRGIAEDGARVALYYDGIKDFIMTSVLDVGEKGYWVEQGTDAAKNRRIAESKRLTLVSVHNHVKIQFVVGAIRELAHQNYPAFYMPFPAHLCRIQRREYFRLTIPLSEHLRCVTPAGQVETGKIEIPIMDISGGGVRLSYAEEAVEFVIGQTYAGCQIDLPEVGKISVTLMVKSVVSMSPKPGQTIRRVGCEFKNLDNASSVLLQRYVTNMQRLKNDPQ